MFNVGSAEKMMGQATDVSIISCQWISTKTFPDAKMAWSILTKEMKPYKSQFLALILLVNFLMLKTEKITVNIKPSEI